MGRESHNVVTLPLTKERLTDIAREIGKDSERWPVIIPYGEDQNWQQSVNRRQIELCLREGYVVEKRVTADKHGYWRFNLVRVCSGMHVQIEVALEPDGPERKLIVIGVKGDRIEG